MFSSDFQSMPVIVCALGRLYTSENFWSADTAIKLRHGLCRLFIEHANNYLGGA